MIKVTDMAFVGRAITDVARARSFYEGVLGLEAATVLEFEHGHWWIEYEMPGGTLALSNAWPPSGHGVTTMVAFEVADFEAAVTEVKRDNVSILYGPIETPVCQMVGIADPDGNAVTLHHRKPVA